MKIVFLHRISSQKRLTFVVLEGSELLIKFFSIGGIFICGLEKGCVSVNKSHFIIFFFYRNSGIA